MFKNLFNISPIYWLVLGTLWSVSFLLFVFEHGFSSSILIGVLAVYNYTMAIIVTLKNKSKKGKSKKADHYEEDGSGTSE